MTQSTWITTEKELEFHMLPFFFYVKRSFPNLLNIILLDVNKVDQQGFYPWSTHILTLFSANTLNREASTVNFKVTLF